MRCGSSTVNRSPAKVAMLVRGAGVPSSVRAVRGTACPAPSVWRSSAGGVRSPLQCGGRSVPAPERGRTHRVNPTKGHAVSGGGFGRTLTDLARERERLLAHAPHFGHTCLNRDQRRAEIRVSTQQQRRQAGNQPFPVVHFTEEFYDLSVKGRALHQIATERAYHPQQIQRLRDSIMILHLLEDGQRLLVAAQRLERLLDVHVPVAQAVEALCKQFRIGKLSRTVNGAAEVRTRLLVITFCPQETEIKETLPFREAVVSLVGSL